jgi:nucleolar protein 9
MDDDEQQQTRQELLQYFERVEGMLDSSEFDDDESKELFLTNVFEEVKGKEKRLTCDLQCSRVLEKIIGQAPVTALAEFTEALRDEFDDLLGNRYASHVLQAIVAAVHRSLRVKIAEDDEDGEEKTKALEQLHQTFQSLVKSLIANLYDSMTGTYSSHVFRSAILCLAGMPLPSKMRARSSRGYREFFQQDKEQALIVPYLQLPEAFIATLTLAANAMKDDASQLADLLYHNTASPCLQTMLQALQQTKAAKSCDALCLAILGSFSEGNPLTTAIATPVASHTIEVCLQVGSADVVQQIFDQGFRTRCLEQATHGIANFVFQKLLKRADVGAVEAVCDELLDNMEDVLAEGTGSVLVELIAATGRCQTRQGLVIKALAAAFHFDWESNGADVARCLLSVSTLERWGELLAEPEGVPMHLKYTSLGSQMVQSVASMDAICNKGLVNAFGKLSQDEFKEMACHKHGSFALQALLASPSVGGKRKSKLISHLVPSIPELATNKFGSHIVDAAWDAAGIKTKEAMAAALVAKESSVKDTPQGKFVWRNCKLDVFKRNKDDWYVQWKSEVVLGC